MAILKRTIYIDQSKSYVKFGDWAMVTTSLGNMAEPFQFPGLKHTNDTNFSNYAYDNEMSMINMIKPYSNDIMPSFLSGGARPNESPTIGGNLTLMD